MRKSPFSSSAALLLGSALHELYPEVKVLASEETSFGFTSLFHFPHTVHEETPVQIEEKMRQIIREKREIETLEMVGFSAQGLLLKEGAKERASQIEDAEALFLLGKIGAFTDLSFGPLLKNTMELGAFKILDLEKEGPKILRVTGSARQSKQEIKDFLKKWALYPKIRHEMVGENLQFWKMRDDGVLWLPKGLKIREILTQFLKKSLFQGAKEIVSPIGADRFTLYQEMGGKVAEVAFDGREAHLFEDFPLGEGEVGLFQGMGEIHLLLSEIPQDLSKGITSSLQRVGKTLNILGFKPRILFRRRKALEKRAALVKEGLDGLGWTFEESAEGGDPRVEFLIEDGLGRAWAAAGVSLLPKNQLITYISVERNLALLVEKQDVPLVSVEELEKRLRQEDQH